MKKDIFTITQFADFLRAYPHILDTVVGREWIAQYSFSNNLAIKVDDQGWGTGLDKGMPYFLVGRGE